MDRLRFARGVRALRRRRHLTQAQLAARLGWSRSKVSRIETGRLVGVAFDDLERLASELDARVQLDLAWRGASLDRLIDDDHAALVDATVRWLTGAGWNVVVEASFSIFGERGSIDVFASHPAGALLVIEVKASIGDANRTLIGVDRKVRLAPRIAKDRGWPVGRVGAVLVVASTTIAPSDRPTWRHVPDRAAEHLGGVSALGRVTVRPARARNRLPPIGRFSPREHGAGSLMAAEVGRARLARVAMTIRGPAAPGGR